MSRLIVKNLPRKIKEAQVRAHFEPYGTVTDCSLKYNADGGFRNFAFVGFKLDTEAEMAMKKLNKSVIEPYTLNIEVSLAADLSIAKVAQKTSKHSKSGNNIQKKAAEKPKEVVASEESLLSDHTTKDVTAETKPLSDREFIKSITSLRDGNSEDDSSSSSEDEDDDSSAVKSSAVVDKDEAAKKSGGYKIVMRGLPSNVKEVQIREFFKPIKLVLVSIPKNARRKRSTCIVTVTLASESERNEALRRNKNYIGTKRIFLNVAHDEAEPVKKDVIGPRKLQEKEVIEPDVIAETGRLFIRNLAYCCTEEDLEKLFAEYHPSEVHLPIDRFTKKVTGIAFVSFEAPEDAVRAFNNLDGTIFQGRMLHLVPGKAKKNQIVITDDMSFAKKKKVPTATLR